MNIKKIIFLLTIIGIAVTASAQSIIKPESYADSCAWKTEQGKYIPDLVVYYDTTSGYICGNGSLKMKTKAQKYFLTGGDTIIQVAFLFGKKNVGNNPGTIRAKVYAADGVSGSPGILLGESVPLSTSLVKASLVNVDSISKLTVVNFLQPVAVTDSFFVALDLTQLLNGDSIGLFSTKHACFSGKQLAWEEDSNGIWHPFNDGTGATYRLNIDMAIFPNRNFPVGIGELQVNNSGVVAYPNPASNEIYFRLNNKLKSEVDIYISDVLGKEAKRILNVTSVDGIIQLAIEDLNHGIYFYLIREEEHVFTGKFLVSSFSNY